MDWSEQDAAQRAENYAGRMAQLAELMVDVRTHRLQDCEGHPLCPGPAAVDKVNSIPYWLWGDFIVSCLARMADQEGELENLRKEREHARTRAVVAEKARVAAEQDADAGWAAYREMKRELAASLREARGDAP